MALTAFGIPHVMGYLPTREGQYHAAPLGLDGLMDAAVELGLTAIEAPIAAGTDTARLKDQLAQRALRMVPDFGVLVDNDVPTIRKFLETAARLGAPVVRATISSVLCGDRRTMPAGWQEHLRRTACHLEQVLPYAEQLGVVIAVENHQDAGSKDFLRLHEMTGHHPVFGVTLDAGNPLAVAEDPLEFAQTVSHLIRHIHMKDYTIHFAPEGFRLVRCAAGDGVVDFAALIGLVAANGQPLLPAVEIAAQPTRTIPFLDPEWWSCHEPPGIEQLLPVLRTLWAKGRPAGEPYSSAWERGEGSEAVSAEEWDVLRRSVRYFRKLSESTTGTTC